MVFRLHTTEHMALYSVLGIFHELSYANRAIIGHTTFTSVAFTPYYELGNYLLTIIRYPHLFH